MKNATASLHGLKDSLSTAVSWLETAGIVVAVLVAVGLVCWMVFCAWARRKYAVAL